MGDLLLFRPSSKARSTAPRTTQTAEIVFFTGVRYERFEAPAPLARTTQPPPEGGLKGRGRSKRKRRA